MNYKILLLLICFFPMGLSCSSNPSRRRPPSNVQPADNLDDKLDAPDITSGDPAPNFSIPGHKTKYQTVSEGYDSAQFPADLTDFDSLDEPIQRTKCFSVKAFEPSVFSEFVIKQMMVQLEGNPDYGPLFPGSTDRVEPRLVIGKNNGWVNSQNLTNEKRQVFDLGRMPNTTVIRINENKFGIYQDIGAPAEVWIRKNRTGLIFFKVYKVEIEHKKTEVFAGYCFRK